MATKRKLASTIFGHTFVSRQYSFGYEFGQSHGWIFVVDFEFSKSLARNCQSDSIIV